MGFWSSLFSGIKKVCKAIVKPVVAVTKAVAKVVSTVTNVAVKAINYINKVSTPDQPNYQGFYLNYTTFLYEIMGQKIEAIELSNKIFDKCLEAYDEIMEQYDCIYSESTVVLQLLKDNADKWTQEMSLANE